MRTIRDLIADARLTPAQACHILDVSPRTLARWQHRDGPKPARDVLTWYADGVPVSAPGFAGFQFGRDGALYTPEGERVTAGELRALPFTRQRIAYLERERLEPRQHRLL